MLSLSIYPKRTKAVTYIILCIVFHRWHRNNFGKNYIRGLGRWGGGGGGGGYQPFTRMINLLIDASKKLSIVRATHVYVV